MKNCAQMVFSKTFLTLVLTVVLCISFAASLFAVMDDAGIALISQPVAEVSPEFAEVATVNEVAAIDSAVAESTASFVDLEDTVAPVVPIAPASMQEITPFVTTIPIDFAPTVSHTTVGGDPTLLFPYRILLEGLGGVESFNFYIVNTVTREVVTTPAHKGDIVSGWGSSIDMSACGEYIYLVPSVTPPFPGVRGGLIVFLRDGEEVVITTSTDGNTPPPNSVSAPGLQGFAVDAFFKLDSFPPAATFPPEVLGELDEFEAVHRKYTFHLNNPSFLAPAAPPLHFHSGFIINPGAAVLFPYVEGFLFSTLGNLQQRIINGPVNGSVRIEAVWTLDNVLPLVKNFEVPEGVTLADATFEFTFDGVEIEGSLGAVPPPITGIEMSFTNINTVGAPTATVVLTERIVDVLDNIVFIQAGVHVYKVSEIPNTVTGLPAGQEVDYSEALLKVLIDVREDTDNAGEFLIYSITIYALQDDAGEDIDPAEVVDTLVFNNVLEIDPCPECTWGPWVVTTPPTCCAPGEETRTCTVCGETETRPVPPIGCNWSEWEPVTPANCVTYGEERRVCLTCVDVGCNCCPPETRPIPPIPCDWGPWTPVTPPNCHTDGLERREKDCDKCDDYEVRPIPPSPCDWGDWVVTRPPGIGTPGEERREKDCEKCDDYETRPIPPLPAPDVCDVCEQDPCICDTKTLETTPTVPGNDTGNDRREPGPGPKTGDSSNPTMHLLHMLAAVLLVVAVAYRLACPTEVSMGRREGQYFAYSLVTNER